MLFFFVIMWPSYKWQHIMSNVWMRLLYICNIWCLEICILHCIHSYALNCQMVCCFCLSLSYGVRSYAAHSQIVTMNHILKQTVQYVIKCMLHAFKLVFTNIKIRWQLPQPRHQFYIQLFSMFPLDGSVYFFFVHVISKTINSCWWLYLLHLKM